MPLPASFIRAMQLHLSQEELSSFLHSLEEEPEVSVRYNPFKPIRHLSSEQARVKWSSAGYYLSTRPPFTFDPHFHAGGYYVQEASSMFLEQALRQIPNPSIVLDLCAAPGGKSTLLRSLLPEGSFLVSNEPVRKRAQILAENIIKWGHEACMVTCNYPDALGRMGALFDLIVADVPCSGEGMFRKDNPAIDQWGPDLVATCACRQRDILTQIWPALRQGGYLVYSTCTYNTEENEDNVHFIATQLGAEVVPVPCQPSWRVTGNLAGRSSEPVYRFFPHRVRGEGFFMALLRKTSPATPFHVKNKVAGTRCQLLPQPYSQWLSANPALSLMSVCGPWEHVAFQRDHLPLVDYLSQRLNVMHAGIPLFVVKGRRQIPCHALAMSRLLHQGAVPRFSLSYDQAISYLSGLTLSLPDAPTGIILLDWEGHPLGFANNLGNRANNLYPPEWRIRSTHRPIDPVF